LDTLHKIYLYTTPYSLHARLLDGWFKSSAAADAALFG